MSRKDKFNTLLGNEEGISKNEKEKSSLKAKKEEFKQGILSGDERTWKIAFRTFLILVLGAFASAAVFADFVLDNQFKRFTQYNTVLNPNGATLSPGRYILHQVITVGRDHQKYLIISPFSGGLMFSTPAPAEMEFPKDLKDYYILINESREISLKANLATDNPELLN